MSPPPPPAHLAEPVDEFPSKPDPDQAAGARTHRPQERCLDGLVRGRGDCDCDHGCKLANGRAVPAIIAREGGPDKQRLLTHPREHAPRALDPPGSARQREGQPM